MGELEVDDLIDKEYKKDEELVSKNEVNKMIANLQLYSAITARISALPLLFLNIFVPGLSSIPCLYSTKPFSSAAFTANFTSPQEVRYGSQAQ